VAAGGRQTALAVGASRPRLNGKVVRHLGTILGRVVSTGHDIWFEGGSTMVLGRFWGGSRVVLGWLQGGCRVVLGRF
jgi:hypothetical protein